jgi:hypothetical protein
MRREQVGLMPREGRAHERHDRRIAGLMHRQRVKEAFDDDDRACGRLQRPVEIEEHERLAETGRKSILRSLTIDGAACIGDELAAFVVDGNMRPRRTHCRDRSQTKRPDRPRSQAAPRQIRVMPVDVLQRQMQRRVRCRPDVIRRHWTPRG